MLESRVDTIQKAFRVAYMKKDIENAQRFAVWLSDLKLTAGDSTIRKDQHKHLTRLAIKAHEYLRSQGEA